MKEKKTDRIAEIVYEAIKEINASGGEIRLSDLYAILETKISLTDYEKQQTQSGIIRWRAYLTFYSIEIAKVGYIIKKNGIWHITEEGSKAISNTDAISFFKDFHSKYAEIRKADAVSEIDNGEDSESSLDELQSQASKGIRDYIIKKNPYEFQELVAALLRAMGYYTPFIAPKGKDGGIDIIAYRDPLGTTSPQLKVQVKHYPSNPISVDVVRSLGGVLVKEGEVGLLVTSGTFTNDAKKEARSYHRHLRLIDIDEFIELWTTYYNKMEESDKAQLPIMPIYFIKQ